MITRRISKLLVLFLLMAGVGGGISAQELTPEEEFGKAVFFDENLSFKGNQSCAACHTPEVGWTGPHSEINAHGAVYEGSISGRFGNRKPPSSAYATPSPILHFQRQGGGLFVGGNFWDGRATGEKLLNPAADQAQGPFLNPVEQALPDNACVVYRVCTADYSVSLEDIRPGACDIIWPDNVDSACELLDGMVALDDENRDKVDEAYNDIALSIAAYEDSSEVNAFSSKYDYYLAGLVELSAQERKGLRLFNGKGKCFRCHISKSKPRPKGEPPLFTDFTYDNVGVPRNPENPWYEQQFNPEGEDWIDLGLGGFLASRVDYQHLAAENNGKQKVPTLRNVDKRPYPEFVKAFGHNGYFKSLKQIVHFYNTRDVKPVCPDLFTLAEEAIAQGCWPAPEVSENINTTEMGDLKLTEEEEDAIVSFLKTLSDGYTPTGQ